MRLLWFTGHRRWSELAAAYADGELSPGERARYEAHLASCDACAGAVVDQRALKRMLAAGLPAATLPRSFAISEAMLAGRGMAVGPARPPRIAMRVAQAMAAVAVLAFAGLVAYDLAPGGTSNETLNRAAPVGDAVPAAAGAEAPSAPLKGVAESRDALPTPAALPTYAPGGGAQAQGDAQATPQSTASGSGYTSSAATPDAGERSLADAVGPTPGPAATPRAPVETGDGVDARRAAEAAMGALAAVALATYFILRTRRRS